MKKLAILMLFAIIILEGFSQTVPVLTTSSATNVYITAATLYGNISSNGGSALTAPTKGFVYSTINATPTVGGANVTQKNLTGTAIGNITSTILTFSPGTHYYYQAFAHNALGYSYGGVVEFTTGTQSSGISFTNINATSLTINWTRGSYDGCIVVMSTSAITSSPIDGYTYTPDPIFGSGEDLGYTGLEYVVYDGTGTFVDITDLTAGTTYYVRIFEYNSVTKYFTNTATNNPNNLLLSGSTIPTITTSAAATITQTSAYLGGNVTADGGATVTARGVCYSLGSANTNPEDGGTGVITVPYGTSGTGSFSYQQINLKPGTIYYFKAYATNSAGTAYGSALNFTTATITQATAITIGTVTETSIAITWSGGDGDQSLVVIHEGTGAFINPSDGTDYNYSTSYGNNTTGYITGTGNYIVYEGSSNAATITNLDPSVTYGIKVFEFVGTGTNTYYQTSNGSGANPNSATTLDATWLGGASNHWSNVSNWSSGKVPISTTNVIIPSGTTYQPILTDANGTCKNMTVNAGASMTINDPRTLTVTGNLLLKTPAGSGAAGQLVIPGTTGTLNVTGTSTMERYYANTNNWRLVSSPLVSPAVTDWNGFYGNSWNASTQAWVHLTAATSIAVMQGISVVDSISSKTLTFTGTFNNGNQSITVTNTPGTDENGWNLVGNPYPSAIDWGTGTGITRTNIQAAAYVYNTSSGSYSICSSPCIIAAGQGFMVHANPSSTLSFTNACRISNSQTFLKNGLVEMPKIIIEARNDFYQTEAFINFEPEASSDYDQEYDAFMLMSTNDTIADIYTLLNNGSKLVINSLNTELLNNLPTEGLEIPIGLTPGINGSIELSASSISSFPEDVFVYLFDKEKNQHTDLRLSSYKIKIDSKTNDRFELLLRNYAVGVKENSVSNSNILIYTYKNSAFVKSDIFELNNANIYVYDIMGKLIVTKPTKHSNTNEIILRNTGTYIIKVIANNKVVTQKVVVQ